MSTFYSNGKLLLTSEYLVLNGALALAVPTKYGQQLTVKEIDEPKLIWESLDENGNLWFNHTFTIDEIATPDAIGLDRNDILKKLLKILHSAKTLNPLFLKSGARVTTSLSFPRNWGLGTSSTLINNIANWANVNPYLLLDLTFGGSGYDIACARNNSPITYHLMDDNNRIVEQVNFNPTFKEHLYFVYLNKKQDSQKAVEGYKSKVIKQEIIEEATALTKAFLASTSLNKFCELMEKHEQLLSKVLELPTIKEGLFSDFNGAIKSLGAWGGDFILVASKENPKTYFKEKGFNIIIPYIEMVKN